MTQQPPPPPNYGQQPPQWAAQPAPHAAIPAPKKRRKWPWIVGAIVLLFVVVGVANGGNTTSPSPSPTPSGSGAAEPEPASSGSLVVYEVIGKGTAGNVTYMKEGFSQEQQTNAKLPFKKELQFKDKVGSLAPLSLVAQNGGSGGDITCRITVDGEVVGESTSSGQYAVVTCNGNG